ncbi:MAG: efflux RND transporter periplasmic adaptor subunit [Betaproteobacteria bacterium]|nr:efflux RND transporter periplasmic adaptor subunit [Betaproteobacteria bacterium]
MEEFQTLAAPRAIRRAWIALAIVLALLALGSIRILILRNARADALAKTAEAHSSQHVTVTHGQTDSGEEQLVLPGTLQGFLEAPIHARTSGYVLRREKDIGSTVKKGELLAELDTPEVDQELAQARATRTQTAASAALAKSSFERWKRLRTEDAVSQQELDERQSTFHQSEADLVAADANVRRLEELERFKRITAPFDGVITHRNIDVGNLVNSGNGGTGQALFTLTRSDPLRLYIDVPQAYAKLVKIGQVVKVRLAETPGERFEGKVSRLAHAIDPATRTMQVEVTLPNPDGKLLSGAYVEAGFPGARAAGSLIVPVNTLLFRKDGPQIAVAGANGSLQLRSVKIGRDYGRTVEIVAGITAQDALIVNPSDSSEDGQKIKIVSELKAK